MEPPMVIQGPSVSADDLRLIRALIADHPSWNRTRLSKHLCVEWDWRNAKGQSGFAAVIALVQRLLDKIAGLGRENEALRAKVASLEKDSTNSSKPPSSDGLKKQRGSPKRGSSRRKPGGQKGHPGQARTPVPRAQVSETIGHKLRACDLRGKGLADNAQGRVVERRPVVEIPQIHPTVTEHAFYALTPARVKQIRIALGTVQNRLEDTSDALEPVCDELEETLAEQSVLNINETGDGHNRKRHWLWAFVTQTFVFFVIRASRGSKVLRDILGDAFNGTIISDRSSAYVKYHKDRAGGLVQYCWVHIMRDVKALPCVRACGSEDLFSRLVRQRVGAVSRIWHAFKRGHLSREELIAKAEVHDGEALYVAFRNKVDPAKPLKTEPRWHTNDAVEVVQRTAADVPIAVLRGYPMGQFESSTEAGAPRGSADTVGKVTSYAARVVSAAEWTAEWRIPFSALNPTIAPGAEPQANFTLHRLANGSEYICWRRVSRRSSWEVAHAGMQIVE